MSAARRLDPRHPAALALGWALVGGLAAASVGLPLLFPDLLALGAFLGLLALFHALEYLLVARFRPEHASLESFLFDPTPGSRVALLAALLEYGLERLLWPQLFGARGLVWLGLAGALLGQGLRTLGMLHARSSFSHLLEEGEKPREALVVDGVYAYLRHPAYTGWFVWAVSTQSAVLGDEQHRDRRRLEGEANAFPLGVWSARIHRVIVRLPAGRRQLAPPVEVRKLSFDRRRTMAADRGLRRRRGRRLAGPAAGLGG